MNADILKRVVRAIADGSQDDLQRLADKIIETERRTGHKRLADQLEAILEKQPRIVGNGHRPTGDVNRKLTELPLSRRHGESLATLIPTEALEHHMVLQAGTEERFARIERDTQQGPDLEGMASGLGKRFFSTALRAAVNRWVPNDSPGIQAYR